jgi:hypothetical protein
MVDAQQQRVENLGPAERIIQTLVGFTDHLVHNRAGMVSADASTAIGVRWDPVTTTTADGHKPVVYKLLQKGAVTKVAIPGKEKPLVIKGVPVGMLSEDKTIRDFENRKVAEFRPAGLFPEVAVWMYRQVAEVWKLDNEFAAKWASYAYANDTSRDLKVVLAAFLMVQSRKGDPVLDGGVLAFHDDDFRDVGEAMALNIDKGKSLDAKLLLRVHSLLTLPGVAEINRELGFGRSARRPFLGRWPVTVTKFLAHRELNPQLLDGLVKAGFKETIKNLARKVGYKPVSEKFYETLRWKQAQSKDGRRSLAIGKTVKQAESWEDLTEEQICERIVSRKIGYKVITGLLPKRLGLTRAIMAAAVEAGSLSNKDLVIATPTLEALGLLQVQDIRAKWQAATQAAEDQRSANIARNVKSKETKEVLQVAAEVAVQKAVAEVLRGLVIYFLVDISGSMTNAIEQAKVYLGKLLPAFPLDKIHIAVFQTVGREVKLKAASQAAVNQAFVGINAGGGTNHGAGFMTLAAAHKPAADEDLLVIVVGDEQDHTFAHAVRASGVNPVAFGLLKVSGSEGDRAVRGTAAELGVPCFRLDAEVFADPYAVPQRLRSLIAATPVGVAAQAARVVPRVTLVEQILATKLLDKPAWAA